MVLEQFIIDADIIWDQVGKTFFENPEAKPGRIMRVQVVNAGIIEDLTGYTLNLGWTSVRDPSKFGLDAFDDVDITKGIFEIEYTSGMLTNVGPLNATLQLVPPGEGRPIESNNFKLTVKNSAINPEAIQGETSFKALENALVEVNGWNARIDVVEQEFRDRADALDGAYPVRLTAAEQSVSQKVGGGVKAEPEDLSAATLGLVTGTGGPINLLSVPQDKSVTPAKTNFLTYITNLANPEDVETGKYWIGGTPITSGTNVDYNRTKVPVKPLSWYSLNKGYSPNFSLFGDANGNSLGKVSEALVKDSTAIFQTPENCTWLYLSVGTGVALSDLVALNIREDISAYTVATYPYGIFKHIEMPDLMVNEKPLSDLLNPSYASLENKKDSLTHVSESWSIFSEGTLSRVGDSVKWTGLNAYKGLFKTTPIVSNAERVRMTINGTFEGLTKVDMMLRYTDSLGAVKYELMDEAVTSPFNMSFEFDPNYYAVYKDMVSFGILVRNAATVTVAGSFTIDAYETTELDVEILGIYAPDLKTVLKNIDSRLVSQTVEPSENVFMRNATGDNYKLQIDPTGQLISVPTVPTKTLVMGNSLVFGIADGSNPDGSFGMCASSYDKDFYNRVKQAILAKKPSATFDRLHVGMLEQGTMQSDYDTYITTNASYFTSDLDLIILQIGDNVNTAERKAYFESIMPQFMQYIRTQCPKARIIAVSGWFGATNSVPTMLQVSADFGAELITITHLNIVENQGYSGQIITKYDNTTIVAGENWITHPGDLGFAEIADLLITQMQM